MLGCSQLVLRSLRKRIGSVEELSEVGTLMIIECEIERTGVSHLRRPDDAYLVEGRMTLLALDIYGRIAKGNAVISTALGDDAGREGNLILAEKTHTGRVGADGRDISTQGLHRTTHTYIAGGTRELAGCQLGILIGFLRSGTHGSHERTGKKYMF